MLTSTAEIALSLATLFAIFIYSKATDVIERNIAYPLILCILALALSIIVLMQSNSGGETVTSALFASSFPFVRSLILGVVGITIFQGLGLRERLALSPNPRLILSSIKPIPIILLTIGYFAYSVLLFSFLEVVKLPSIDFQGIESAQIPIVLSTIAYSAINEELAIRIGLISIILFSFQSSPNKWKYAIILSSVVWALMHIPNMSLLVPKFLQVFPFGLFLGWVMQKYGFPTSFLSHLGANAFIVSLSIV